MRRAVALFCSLWLGACGGSGDPEAEAYAKLEGIYEITSVDRYPGACEARGEAQAVDDFSAYWVAFEVSRQVPDLQLHAHGCTTPERCRDQALDVQADGSLDSSSYWAFQRHVYSRVASDGAIDGVGVTLVGVLEGKCRLVLEETSIAQAADETLFQARERTGTEYEPDSDGSCPQREDLSAKWRDWTDHPCLGFDVIHTRWLQPL